jgi:hypothetical protein
MPVKVFISIPLSVVLVFAFMQAPSLHVHSHEATERHAATFLHTHVPHVEAPSESPEWRDFDPDDDAQFLNWTLIAPNYDGLAPLYLVESTVILLAPVLSEWRTAILRPSAHDPPVSKTTSPRAPPV